VGLAWLNKTTVVGCTTGMDQARYCVVGLTVNEASSKIFKSFPNTFNFQTLKNRKHLLPEAQKFPNLAWGMINSKATTFHSGGSSNSQQNFKQKFRKQYNVEFCLNFKRGSNLLGQNP
jgi:hypothetical protein